MKIRTQFTITVVLFGVILVTVGASLLFTNRKVERLQKQEELAHALELGARELSYLFNDYLLHGERQQRARWEARLSSFSDILDDFNPEGQESAAMVKDIRANRERLESIFADVVTIFESSPPDRGTAFDIAVIRVNWSRMEILNQGMAFEASRLARILKEQAEGLRHQRVIRLFVLIGVSGAFLIINYLTVNRRILRAIADLRAGTKIIGSGNLEFVIEEKEADEIGDLSRAFNRMTANLKAVTASKADLEQEMRERQQAEEALKESEAKYRSLFENMTEGFALHEIITDNDGKPIDYRFLETNPAFERLTGLSPEAVIGKTVREIIPNVEAYWMETYGRVALEGTAAHIENYSASLKRWYEVFAYRTAPRQFAVFFTDITERKKNEEELRRLSQFPEENPNPVLRCAPDGEILFANASARNWLAMLGWQTGDVLPSPVRTAVVEARGKDHAVETEITCRAGRTFSIFSLQPEDEDYINLYGLDITKRKLAEEALRAGEERLRASLGEKEVLLKEIHHRVKNNMQVISSLIALQADEVHDAAMHAILLEVTHRVRSMAMVHEKLYQSADLARVEFADYAQSLLNYLWRAHRTEAFGVGLTLDLEPVTLPVNAAVPCGLILNELIGNALKHAFRDGSGDGEVSVSLKKDGQGRVSLCVRDNGIGLPAGLDWRQAQSLGLRLVQMLAGQLGGTVECSSNPGTQFRVTFTVKETDV